MSNTLKAAPTPRVSMPRRTRLIAGAALAAGGLIVLALPLYLPAFGLQLVVSVCALGVGAIGLTMLSGAGQLSLANPFFMALGALTYVVFASEPDPDAGLVGLGLPPVFAMIAGVAVAGIAGLLFAPISSRLKGIYLGMSSLGLVFLGEHIFNNSFALTGGFNGRATPDFEIFGVVFGRGADQVVILGVPFGRLEWLWYLAIVCVVAAALFARNILRSRPGRALKLIAAGEITASVAGVHVKAYKARVFFLSSLYAGLSGVLYALSIGSIAPSSFNFDLSLRFLAMIVIGGMGSIGGALAGTAFVVCLPLVLQPALAGIAFLEASDITASHVSRYIYGAAIIAVLLFQPSGLAGLGRTVSNALRRRRALSTPNKKE